MARSSQSRKRQNLPGLLHRRLNAYVLAASATGAAMLPWHRRPAEGMALWRKEQNNKKSNPKSAGRPNHRHPAIPASSGVLFCRRSGFCTPTERLTIAVIWAIRDGSSFGYSPPRSR